MFKKKKKDFPTGTFIPFPGRLLAIIQLCLTFSLLLWDLAQPFMGEYFSIRSRMLLYEYVQGSTTGLLSNQPHQLIKLQRNAKQFTSLPYSQQEFIKKDYEVLLKHISQPFLIKMKNGIHRLFTEMPLLELSWLCLSILIPILILLKKEGAVLTVWILPILAFSYAVDNRLNGYETFLSPDTILFPTEQTILTHYLETTLSSNWLTQQEQLKTGWENYLIKNWTSFSNENNQKDRTLLVEEGEFNFTLARLQHLHNQSLREWLSPFNEKLSYFKLGLYLAWTLFFALMINRHKKEVFRPTLHAT